MKSSPTWASILLCFHSPALSHGLCLLQEIDGGFHGCVARGGRQVFQQTIDLRLIREGTPAFLMLMDGMIEALPDTAPLLLAAARAYSSYASTFMDEEDQEYAKVLLKQAKDYALRALEIRGSEGPCRALLKISRKL